MHNMRNDLEWAAVQLDDVCALLESFQLMELSASVLDIRRKLAQALETEQSEPDAPALIWAPHAPSCSPVV